VVTAAASLRRDVRHKPELFGDRYVDVSQFDLVKGG
jgi:hypothetical protein